MRDCGIFINKNGLYDVYDINGNILLENEKLSDIERILSAIIDVEELDNGVMTTSFDNEGYQKTKYIPKRNKV